MFHLFSETFNHQRETKAVSSALLTKPTWGVCHRNSVTGGLGGPFKLGGDLLRMWGKEQLLWCLPEF